MAYQSKYKPKNVDKYLGDVTKVICRSLWERSFAKYCDKSVVVKKWAIEPFAIPYFDAARNKKRKYYPDFYVEYNSGDKYLIEIKPKAQTKPPKKRKKTKLYLKEVATYTTNTCKWSYAKTFCNEQGIQFLILTEDGLAKMGIRVIGNKKKYYAKKRKRTKR